jgi:hypothetical protein
MAKRKKLDPPKPKAKRNPFRPGKTAGGGLTELDTAATEKTRKPNRRKRG